MSFAPISWRRAAASRIAAQTRPEKIVLFGSYARGTPSADSDFDLLVLLEKPAGRSRRYALVQKAIGPHLWPVDLLVRSPEEVRSRLLIGDTFFEDIMSQGKVLYES